jgi:4-amino-4-deoxy-L-arabinose transferase-like glycosyltransferase
MNSRLDKTTPSYVPWAFFALAACLLAFNSWSGSVIPGDDAIYAQIADEALRDGRLFHPTWQGALIFEKGPLVIWTLTISQWLFGQTMFAVRLPGVLAGSALLLAVHQVGRKVGLSKAAALISVGALLATAVFYFNARRPMMDVPGTALGMWAFVCLLTPSKGTWRSAIIGGVLLGLAALTKFVAPIPFVIALIMLQFFPQFRRVKPLLAALVVALLVAAPWHIAMLAIHGRPFFDAYFVYNLFNRMSDAVVGQGAGFTYANWIFSREWALIIPWLAGAVVSVFGAVKRRDDGLVAVALVIGGVLPLTVSATGISHYLVPVAPGFALMVGILARSLGQRVVVEVVAAVVLAGAFIVANGKDLLRPDYSSGTQAICEGLNQAGLQTAGTWNLHDPAVTWYCNDFKGYLYADNPGVLGATKDIPMLKDWVIEVDDASLLDLASKRSIVITSQEPIADLLAKAIQLGLKPEVVGNSNTRAAVLLK